MKNSWDKWLLIFEMTAALLICIVILVRLNHIAENEPVVTAGTKATATVTATITPSPTITLTSSPTPLPTVTTAGLNDPVGDYKAN